MPDRHPDAIPKEYEGPEIVSLGSMDDVTRGFTGDSEDNSITATTITTSDVRLKTEIETVTHAVGRLRRLQGPEHPAS